MSETPSEPARRPGGRTARNLQAVHRAVEELITEGGLAAVTIPAVAERSGVHHTTVYRRWGSIPDLLFDVILAAATASIPIDDTGSLRGDLREFAGYAARTLATPVGSALAQTLLSLPLEEDASRRAFWGRRHAVLRPMFDRAADRGEPTGSPEDVLETLLAPIYFRLFVTARPVDDVYLDVLVERALGE